MVDDEFRVVDRYRYDMKLSFSLLFDSRSRKDTDITQSQSIYSRKLINDLITGATNMWYHQLKSNYDPQSENSFYMSHLLVHLKTLLYDYVV